MQIFNFLTPVTSAKQQKLLSIFYKKYVKIQ